jgi:hypothetical protein
MGMDLWEGASKGLVVYLEHRMVDLMDSCRWISFGKRISCLEDNFGLFPISVIATASRVALCRNGWKWRLGVFEYATCKGFNGARAADFNSSIRGLYLFNPST